MPVSAKDYEWISRSTLQAAGCVTVAAEAQEATVKSAFGADLEPLAADQDHHRSSARFNALSAAVIVTEDNGFQGSRSEVLRAASKASAVGKAASIFWNVEGLIVFSCARRGKLLSSLELLDVNEESLDGLPKSLHRMALSVNHEGVDAVSVGAAMVEKFTGASFTSDQLVRGPSFALTPPPDELKAFTTSQMWLYEHDFPELFTAAVAAPPRSQRRLAAFAAHAAAREIGVEEQPPVRELLSGLARSDGVEGVDGLADSPPPIPQAVTAAASAADRRADAAGFEAIDDQAMNRDSHQLEHTYIYQQSKAWEALRQATHRDSTSAAVTSMGSCLRAIVGSVTRYPAIYVENEHGRYLERVEDVTLGRRTQFVEAAQRVLEGATDVDEAVATLPAPLTEDQRAAALREHQQLFERGEFRVYQIWRS